MNKIVKLATPAVDDNGALRQPAEGALTVSDKLAKRWKAAEVLDGEPEDLNDGSDDDANDGPEYERDNLSELDLKKANKDQLLVIAAYEQAEVPEGDAATKPDLVKAIEAKRNASAS